MTFCPFTEVYFYQAGLNFLYRNQKNMMQINSMGVYEAVAREINNVTVYLVDLQVAPDTTSTTLHQGKPGQIRAKHVDSNGIRYDSECSIKDNHCMIQCTSTDVTLRARTQIDITDSASTALDETGSVTESISFSFDAGDGRNNENEYGRDREGVLIHMENYSSRAVVTETSLVSNNSFFCTQKT